MIHIIIKWYYCRVEMGGLNTCQNSGKEMLSFGEGEIICRHGSDDEWIYSALEMSVRQGAHNNLTALLQI